MSSSGRPVLDEFQLASEWLYVTFAEGWCAAGDKTIEKAFSDFRNILVWEADRENPGRAKFRPFPLEPVHS